MTDQDSVQESVGDDLPVSRSELASRVAELEGAVQALTNLTAALGAQMIRNADEFAAEVNGRVSLPDLQSLRKELEKVRDRVHDIADEVGYGDSVDVARIPPRILEAVYQTILDDIVDELKAACGLQDTELHIHRSLEELRRKTSGSELFQYRPHRLHVAVGMALEKGRVSARQIQMTYEELTRHLLEPIAAHAPKNFRSLIRIKSQEYALEQALNFAKAWAQAGPRMEQLSERIALLEEQVTGALRDVREFAGQLRETLAATASQESVEAMGMRLAAMESRRTDGPRPAATTQGDPHPSPEGSGPMAVRVLAALSDEPRSLAALQRELGIEESALREVLDDLGRRGLISSSARGRHTLYRKKEVGNDA